jgi:hypothetical protein
MLVRIMGGGTYLPLEQEDHGLGSITVVGLQIWRHCWSLKDQLVTEWVSP